MTLVSKKARVNKGEQYYRQMVMDGRGTVDQIAKELRRAGISANSDQVAAENFLIANSEQIVFEADLDENGTVERIEYRLQGDRLERSVVTKNADGSVPQSRYETVAERVDNGGLPVFTFDGDLSGDKPVSASPQQVRVMLLLRSPVKDRKSGRARTVGFEAVAQRYTPAPLPADGIGVAPVGIEASTPEAAPAPVDTAISTPAAEPLGEAIAVPTAKLFTPVPTKLGVDFKPAPLPISFPRHLDLPSPLPAGVVIATTAVAPSAPEAL
jgi:hypothetical protein